MKFGRTLRSWHKWLALALGIQLLVWSVSGFYMVAVSIDFIHGDHLVRDTARPLPPADSVLTIPQIVQKHPDLLSVRLTSLPGFAQPVYELTSSSARVLIDAVSGEVLSPLPQERIEALAREYYAEDGKIMRAELISTAPVEARGRRAPLWRVDFEDSFDSTLYIDPDTGALMTRRHSWWRLYDTFWMLHLMDYGDERDDVNNNLLRYVAMASTLVAITGLVLLFFSFRRVRPDARRPS